MLLRCWLERTGGMWIACCSLSELRVEKEIKPINCGTRLSRLRAIILSALERVRAESLQSKECMGSEPFSGVPLRRWAQRRTATCTSHHWRVWRPISNVTSSGMQDKTVPVPESCGSLERNSYHYNSATETTSRKASWVQMGSFASSLWSPGQRASLHAKSVCRPRLARRIRRPMV